MKKLLLILLFIVLVAPCFGAFTRSVDNRKTYKNAYRWTGKPRDFILDWAQEVEGRMLGTSAIEGLFFDPTDTEPGTSKGMFYFDESESKPKYYNGSNWIAIEAGTSGNSLDSAYNVGSTITVDSAVIAFTSTDALNAAVLAIDQKETGAYNALTLTGDASEALILLDQDGSGGDIEGSDASWSITKVGVATVAGINVGATNVVFTEPSSNDITLTADADSVLTILATSKEDLDINLHAADVVSFASSTGVVTVGWGALDAHTGLASLTGDAGENFVIGAENTGTFNVILQQTGVSDEQVIVQSSGNAANAVELISSVAGITLTSADDLTVVTTDDVLYTVGDDYTISGATGGVFGIAANAAAQLVTVGNETGVSALHLLAGTGDIDIQGVAASTITIGDAAQTAAITIGASTATMTDLSLGTGVGAHTIHIGDGGTAAQILTIGSNSVASSIDMLVGTGNFTLDGVAASTYTIGNAAQTGAITIGASTATMTDLSLGTGVGAHTIHIGDGGTAAQLVTIGSTSAASAVTVQAGTGKLTMTSAGTSTDAIDIDVTAGGIDIDMAGGAAGEDFSIVTATSIDFQPSEAQPGQFKVVAGGTNAGDVIELESTDGRILLDANGGDNGDIELNSADDIVLTTAGKLTITNNSEPMTISGALSVTSVTQTDTVVTTGAFSVTVAMSGKILVIPDLAGNTTLTLPVEADGLNYEFWYVGAAAEAHDHNITSADVTNYFIGGVAWIDPANTVATVFSDGSANYIFTMVNMSAGTRVKITCDGVKWYITGVVVSDTTPTMTGA